VKLYANQFRKLSQLLVKKNTYGWTYSIMTGWSIWCQACTPSTGQYSGYARIGCSRSVCTENCAKTGHSFCGKMYWYTIQWVGSGPTNPPPSTKATAKPTLAPPQKLVYFWPLSIHSQAREPTGATNATILHPHPLHNSDQLAYETTTTTFQLPLRPFQDKFFKTMSSLSDISKSSLSLFQMLPHGQSNISHCINSSTQHFLVGLPYCIQCSRRDSLCNRIYYLS
jgi:hypothetical protein